MTIDADVSDGRSSVNEVEGGKILSSADVEGGTTTTLLVVSEIDIEIKLLYISVFIVDFEQVNVSWTNAEAYLGPYQTSVYDEAFCENNS